MRPLFPTPALAGRRGVRWSPLLLPTMTALFDLQLANSAVVGGTGGDKVIQLTDMSGNGRHFSQASDSSRLSLSATGFDGVRPGLFRSSGSRFMTRATGTDFFPNVASGFVAVVARFNDPSVSLQAVFAGAVSPGNIGIVRSTTGGWVGSARNFFVTSPNNSPPANTSVVVEWSLDAGVMRYRQGQTERSLSGVPDLTGLAAMIIFATNTGGSWSLNGTIGSIVFCSARPAANDLTSLRSYLSNRWAALA